ncbi:MAG: rubrerythrin-like domain-containing protein [Halobacteriales archaeon]
MAGPEPAPPDGRYRYECLSCGARLRADTHPGRCPECTGLVQPLSAPR